jgi:uncharacterized protein (UPF0333 family)
MASPTQFCTYEKRKNLSTLYLLFYTEVRGRIILLNTDTYITNYTCFISELSDITVRDGTNMCLIVLNAYKTSGFKQKLIEIIFKNSLPISKKILRISITGKAIPL